MSAEVKQAINHDSQQKHIDEENTVEIGEEVQAKDAAGEFKNCIKETLTIVRNVSVKKKAPKEDSHKA